MKKIIIFISLFFMFTINTFAYVDFTELGQDGTYTFTDDFKEVKLKKYYVVWETDRELAIITSDSTMIIDEFRTNFFISCAEKCEDLKVYKYVRNQKSGFSYVSTSSSYNINYGFSGDMISKVSSNTVKVNYKEVFPDLITYYSNFSLTERYMNLSMPKKELPTSYKNKLDHKNGDILAELGEGIDKLFGGIGGWFNQLFGWLGDILQAIKDIPNLIINGILDGLKALFIPSDDYFSNQFDGLKNKFNNIFRIDISFLNYSGSARQINQDDFTLVNEWGTFKLLDLTYLNSAFDKIRPILRGFFGFLILLFNVDQFGRFIGVGGLSNIVTIVKGESKK